MAAVLTATPAAIGHRAGPLPQQGGCSDLNYLYKAFAPTDIAGAISGVRALGIRGCAVSMPYKEHVIPLVDEMDASASAIQSVNTIVNTDGHLRAYNTDYLAVTQSLASHQVPTDDDFAILGSGGMAKAVVAAAGQRVPQRAHHRPRREHRAHPGRAVRLQVHHPDR